MIRRRQKEISKQNRKGKNKAKIRHDRKKETHEARNARRRTERRKWKQAEAKEQKREAAKAY